MDIWRDQFDKRLPELLHIALKLEIGWLFKDIVCLASGDSTRSDEQVRRQFESGISSIILDKRAKLRKMVQDIQFDLLTIELPAAKTEAQRKALFSFRDKIIMLFRSAKARPWKEIAYPYYSWEDYRYYPEWVAPKTVDPFLKSLNKKADAIIKPLFRSRLSELSDPKRELVSRPLKHWNWSFRCTHVGDDDLPWNKP